MASDTITIYHIFSDGIDYFEDSYKIAKKLYRKLIRKFGNARLYEEKWDDKDSVEPISEDCILSKGEFPW